MSKTIVITGAGVGLGRCLAKHFAAQGHQLALLGRTGAKVEAVAQEIGGNAIAIECNVASPDSVNAAFERIQTRFGKVDVLINNAAIFQPFQVENATDSQIIEAVLTNLAGPMLCNRAAIPLMQAGSQIIHIGSESVDHHLPHLTVYQGTKSGIETFAKYLQMELEPKGIRVTVVRAGSMYEEGKAWEVNRDDAIAFHAEATRRGIHLQERPLTQFTSLTSVFDTLLSLPSDLKMGLVTLSAAAPTGE